MPTFHTDLEIEVDEFVENCSRRDIDELVDYLVDHRYINKGQSSIRQSPAEQLFEKALSKIHDKWNALTAEEEAIILSIANRF
jgi:hypothetical protein